MRISDWSSDVCSSDLTSRIRPCSLAARAPSSQTVSTNLTSRPRPLLWLQSTQGLSPTVTYGKQTPGGGPSNTPLTALARGACARIAATAAACTAITAALIGPLPLPSVRSTEVLRRSPIAAAGSAPSAPARRPQPQQPRPPANPPRSERPAFPRRPPSAPPPAAPPAPSAVRTWLFLTSDRPQIAAPRIIPNKARPDTRHVGKKGVST